MMHIAFAIDHRFVRPCAVTMVSVLRNNVPADVAFHVVGLDLRAEDKAFLGEVVGSYGAAVRFYEVEKGRLETYDMRWEAQRLSQVVFFRCMLSSILPASISKVLYLDCDILVLASLRGLWDTDLEGVALAGVPDSLTVNPAHCRRLHYDLSYNYFNGGVLLLNLDYWRMHGVERQCREHYHSQTQNKLKQLKQSWFTCFGIYKIFSYCKTSIFGYCPLSSLWKINTFSRRQRRVQGY